MYYNNEQNTSRNNSTLVLSQTIIPALLKINDAEKFLINLERNSTSTNNPEDTIINIMTWILQNSEDYYYQNLIYLTNRFKDSELKTTRLLIGTRNYNKDWLDRLINFIKIGTGTFGNIYRAKDKATGDYVTIKEVNPNHNLPLMMHHEIEILFQEKKIFLKANESPFIIKLCGIYVDDIINSYWFIFEWCIGSLEDFMDYLVIPDDGTLLNSCLTTNLIQDIWLSENAYMDSNLEEVVYIYLFEMLGALDYLARRYMVHNDIKPSNILISPDGHLKLCDIGLPERARWIDTYSAIYFLNPDKEPPRLSGCDNKTMCQSISSYVDPEVLIYLSQNADLIYNRIVSPYFPLTSFCQNFLYDVYSVGVCFLDMLFRRISPLQGSKIPKAVAAVYNVDILDWVESQIWNVRVIYDERVRENFLHAILNNAINKNNASIIEFVKTIFLPRSIRCYNCRRTISLYTLNDKIEMSCIDIEKIEQIEFYRTRNITHFNVCSHNIKKTIIDLYTNKSLENKPVECGTFRDTIVQSSTLVQSNECN